MFGIEALCFYTSVYIAEIMREGTEKGLSTKDMKGGVRIGQRGSIITFPDIYIAQ